MNLFGLSVITLIGVIMAVTGLVGVFTYLARFRRTSDRLDGEDTEDKNAPANTFATFFMLNGFLHLGMLLLILGGVGLIFYDQR